MSNEHELPQSAAVESGADQVEPPKARRPRRTKAQMQESASDTAVQEALPLDGAAAEAPAPAAKRAAAAGARKRRAPAAKADVSDASDRSDDVTVSDLAADAALGQSQAPVASLTQGRLDPLEEPFANANANANAALLATESDAGEPAPAVDAAQPGERGRDRRRSRPERGERGERGERRVPQAGEQGLSAQRGRDSDASQGEAQEGGEGSEGEWTPAHGSRRAAMAQQQAQEVIEELVSGAFDQQQDAPQADEQGEEAAAYKRVLRPEPDAPKLQKVLAQAGVGSRRDIEQMIEDGRIEVNDQVAHIGQRVSFGDRVKVAGRPIKVRIAPPAARILAYHKPVGEVVTHDDPQGRPTVFRHLPRLHHGKWLSVGRLDLNTEGLLLFTNSGELANQLMHPRFGVEREYAVRVLGSLTEDAREHLLSGVEIDGQSASFVSIGNGLGEGVNQWYRVVITEGRNREVRKLFDAVGLTVNRLIRVRYGAIVLPRGLRRGMCVELGESDVRAVKALTGLDRQQDDGRRGGNKQGRDQGRDQGRGKQGPAPRQGGQHGPQGGPQAGQGAQQRGKGPRGNGQQGPGAANGNKPRGVPNHAGGQDPRGPRGPQQRERALPAGHDGDEDFDHSGPIPNPLEQTFDRRFAKGSKRITSGFGRPDQDHGQGPSGERQKGPRQPDPMQTSVGYIGADAYFGARSGSGRRGGGGKGRR